MFSLPENFNLQKYIPIDTKRMSGSGNKIKTTQDFNQSSNVVRNQTGAYGSLQRFYHWIVEVAGQE